MVNRKTFNPPTTKYAAKSLSSFLRESQRGQIKTSSKHHLFLKITKTKTVLIEALFKLLQLIKQSSQSLKTVNPTKEAASSIGAFRATSHQYS